MEATTAESTDRPDGMQLVASYSQQVERSQTTKLFAVQEAASAVMASIDATAAVLAASALVASSVRAACTPWSALPIV